MKLLWAIILMSGVLSEILLAQEPARQTPQDIVPPKPEQVASLGSVRVSLEIDPVQSATGGAIEFSIVIYNENSEAVTLVNIKHDPMIRLSNKDGLRVDLPPLPTIEAIKTDDPEATEARWAPRRPVERREIAAPQGNPNVKSLADVVDNGITLQSGQAFRTTFRITKMLADPQGHWERMRKWMAGGRSPQPKELTEPRTAPLIPDEYKLWVSLTLGAARQKEVFVRQVQTKPPIKVVLAE